MFDLRLANSSGNVVNINDGERYEVLSVSGLNPPTASVFSSKSPNRKGRRKNGSTIDYRAMVIQIKLLGDIEKNRNDLYAWTDTETELKIYYSNSTKSVYCEGTVTECDIDLFTDNEVINLAIECDDPYFKELQEIRAEITALLKQFTFPFAISAVGIPFSTLHDRNHTNVFNTGAETGVKITVKCSGTVKNLMIYDADDLTRQFKINHTFPVGYTIEIDTEKSPKTVKAILPDGITVINILKYVAENPTWFTLKKGNNFFGYMAEEGEKNVVMTIGYQTKHLGV
jgi:hypothetical protein